MNTYVYCVDNSGVAFSKVFQVLGENKGRRTATLGDNVYVVVKSLDSILFNLLEEKKKKNLCVELYIEQLLFKQKKR